MATKFSFGNLQFTFAPDSATAPTPREPDAPFYLAVLGDFSGRASLGLREPLANRKVWPVDCDNFEQTFAKLQPQLRLPAPNKTAQPLELRFANLDDFHPDQLLKQAGFLAALEQKRQRLLNPASAPEAVAELQSLLSSPSPPSSQEPAPAGGGESDAETMARLLGGAKPAPSAPKAGASPTAVERLLKEAVGRSLVPQATPQQTALLSMLELELTAGLRSILHNPSFQSLEAAWRGLELLVRNFGAEDNLKLMLVDVSKEELVADLQDHDALAPTGTWKLLRNQFEDRPWAAWLGLYQFGPQVSELELLGRLAKISARAKAPFIAEAGPQLAGCASFGAQPDPDDWRQLLTPEVSEAWQALRALPEAAWVGLALPRFLLRQPYGKGSDPIQAFNFEELLPDGPHESYLWGNPAILCGYLLASAFQAEGWEMPAGGSGEVGELPVHAFKENGEPAVKPCAEAWLGERATELLLSKGFIPVLSVKGRDAVRVASLQSLIGSPLAIG